MKILNIEPAVDSLASREFFFLRLRDLDEGKMARTALLLGDSAARAADSAGGVCGCNKGH